MYSEAQNKATQRYLKKNREQMLVWLPKGKKQTYKDYAESKGKSLAAWVTETLDADMEKDQE